MRLRLETTTAARSGAEQARQAVLDGAQRVIVAGGDGTVRAVAAGLAGTGVPLGILPTGTANLFARNLGLRPRRRRPALSRDLHRAVTGAASAQDVGRLAWRAPDGSEHHDVFLMVLGLGEDAAVVAATSEALKARIGWPAYLLKGAARLRSPLHPIRLRADDGPERILPAWSVLIGNAPQIPLGIRVFPGTLTDSGDLQVLRAAPESLRGWAAIAWHGLLRQPDRAAGLSYETARRVQLDPALPLLLQADGDLLGRAQKVDARVDPGALLVVS